jgi:hypothetical protein
MGAAAARPTKFASSARISAVEGRWAGLAGRRRCSNVGSIRRRRRRALGAFIRADLFPRAAAAFRKFLLRVATPDAAEAVTGGQRCGAAGSEGSG